MSGSLANRLVEVAHEAIKKTEDEFLAMPLEQHLKVDPYLLAARAAVVATLRALWPDGSGVKGEYVTVALLHELAGVVEGGEQDG